MSHIKMKNLLTENMRRFKTKNLKENQLDMFNMSDDEYYHNRPEFDHMDDWFSFYDLEADMKQAIKRQEGSEAITVAKNLLQQIKVGVYKKLQIAKDENNEDAVHFVQEEIDAIQQVNQDVIEDAIKILKVSPKNIVAMQTIYDIIDDLIDATDH